MFKRSEAFLKTSQKNIISLAMRQAFRLLSLPLIELSEHLKEEMEKNPFLEELPTKSATIPHLKKQLQPDCPSTCSFFEFLIQQAKFSFNQKQELQIAEWIIGNLDDRGFFRSNEYQTSLEGSNWKEVLKKIQAFDPPGVGATNLRECLLIQLEIKGKKQTLAYRIIHDHYEDFIHGSMKILQKKLKISHQMLNQTIDKELKCLCFSPRNSYEKEEKTFTFPDVILEKNDSDEWMIKANRELLPSLQISNLYLEKFKNNFYLPEEKQWMRHHLASAKWLLHTVKRRESLLKSLVLLILKKQTLFFEGYQQIFIPVSIREAAEALQVHPSTIARAISHKFLLSPVGTLPLRHFFSAHLKASSGHKISNQHAKQLLLEWIHQENKRQPLSDDLLAKKMKEQGISCARRTIVKYRQALKIPPAFQRRME